jgi:hypothetical protein
MRLSLFEWVQLVAVALVLTVVVTAARERLRTERHCRMVATLVVDCR